MNSAARRTSELILMVAIVGYLIFFLYGQREAIGGSWDLRFGHLLLISACTFCCWMCSSLIMLLVLRSIGMALPFRELYGLHIAAGLLNHLPLRAGTLYRARYLKARVALRYTHFAGYYALNSLLMIICAGSLGSIAALLTYGFRGPSATILVVLLGALAVMALVPLMIALPKVQRAGRIWKMWNGLVDGHAHVTRYRALMPILLLLHVGSGMSAAFRLQVAFGVLGTEVPLGGCLLLSAVGVLSLYVSLTPAGLGVVEFLVGAAASVTVGPFASAVVATSLVRAVALLWYSILGPLSWMWLKLRLLRFPQPAPAPEPLLADRPQRISEPS